MSATHTTSPRPDALLGEVLPTFLATLALLLPTYGALGVTSDAGIWAWFAGSVAGSAAVGALMRLLIPDALALVLLAAGGYIVLVLAGIALVAAVGDPPGNGTVALLAGLPAAAIGALAATVVVRRVTAGALPVGGSVLLVVLLGIAAAPSVGEALEDARDEAADIARLEASGLSPYRPEIGDLTAERSSYSLQDDRIVGYSYRYEVDPGDLNSPYLVVDVVRELPAYRDCDTSERAIHDCREGDGYYVLAEDGDEDYVVATHGGTFLIAWYVEGADRLPDADAIGAALADAEEVDWGDVVEED